MPLRAQDDLRVTQARDTDPSSALVYGNTVHCSCSGGVTVFVTILGQSPLQLISLRLPFTYKHSARSRLTLELYACGKVTRVEGDVAVAGIHL